MASLKEIKNRIGSIKNTLKITSAMKLVASAKLHKAQQTIESMLPYSDKLNQILGNLIGDEYQPDSPYAIKREKTRHVTLVAMSSSASLCGGFNSNIIRETQQRINSLRSEGVEQITLYPIGRKIAQAFSSENGLEVIADYRQYGEKPDYEAADKISSHLMKLYAEQKTDRIELVYTHYKSIATQIITHKQFLPMVLETTATPKTTAATDYLIEPNRTDLINVLLPQSLAVMFYATLLDSNAAEHAARTFAMQQATDNGNALLQELDLMYNKMRQQAITNELLDIVGGSMQ